MGQNVPIGDWFIWAKMTQLGTVPNWVKMIRFGTDLIHYEEGN
mgnify:CR=1 FL=1